MTDYITREASDQAGAFRLQKLRAIKTLLKACERSPDAFVMVALEAYEDFNLRVSGDEPQFYVEEDKDYNKAKSFTINSEPVTNTLISFFDIYIEFRQSPTLTFGFYTTAGIGKEKKIKNTDGSDCNVSGEVLFEIVNGNPNDELLEKIKDHLVFHYRKAYENNDAKGFLSTLQTMKLDHFRSFLHQIDWSFESEGQDKLYSSLEKLISESRFFDIDIEGKEKFIIGHLIDELDRKQRDKSFIGKFLTAAEVKLAFLEAKGITYSKIDPVHEDWDSLPIPDDKRNLREKFVHVCSDMKNGEMGTYARSVSMSKKEEKNGGRRFKALKYRVFSVCEQSLAIDTLEPYVEASVVRKRVDSLAAEAHAHVQELSNDYEYPVKNQSSLKNMVLDLFDGCYLAFDDEFDNVD